MRQLLVSGGAAKAAQLLYVRPMLDPIGALVLSRLLLTLDTLLLSYKRLQPRNTHLSRTSRNPPACWMCERVVFSNKKTTHSDTFVIHPPLVPRTCTLYSYWCLGMNRVYQQYDYVPVPVPGTPINRTRTAVPLNLRGHVRSCQPRSGDP